MKNWTEQAYEDHAERIALAVYETTTGNGRDDHDESHMQNCRAAAANTFQDGISVADWHTAALARIAG